MPLQSQGKRRSAAQDLPVKRFRVSRACDQCRTERSKCDGNQPQCAPCFEGNRACTYTSNPKKRGLPPGYIRTIELALALVLQDADIETSLMNRLGEENTILLARDTKESNRLHKNWRRTRFCKQLNKTLTGDPSNIDGHEEDSEPELPEPMNNISYEPSESVHVVQQPEEMRRVYHQSAIPQPVSSSQELTPLPPECWQLMESYLTYTQCWLPISDKLDVLKLSYSYPIEGLVLSPDMPESGNHAEMWSIFALGSFQNFPSSHYTQNDPETPLSQGLYITARRLVPSERGQFQLGHVKALLNLALYNLQRTSHNAAWILVGAASRILSTLDEMSTISSTRYKHVIASCYLLDNLLAIMLDRRPNFERSDLIRVGSIEEDGLEEWQPWAGELHARTEHQSRLPTLALSTFNRLLDLVGILVPAETARNESMKQLTDWKSKLAPKFDYVRSDSTTIPLTSPAVLLQLTHFATALALTPSQSWLQRILEMLEMCQTQLEPAKLPPVVICLFESIKRSSKSLPLDQATQAKIDDTISSFNVRCPFRHGDARLATSNAAVGTYAQEHFQQAGPSQTSIQTFPPRFNISMSTRSQHLQNAAPLLGDLHSDPDPAQSSQMPESTTFSPTLLETDLMSPALEAYDASVSGDLDSFFDELATLHGAKRLENQPQFMQNLGFAPEISMADLLATQSGQYLSMDPSTYVAEHEGEPLQFPLSDYYDAG